MLKGDIDDVRIYNYALSSDEVNDIYQGIDTEVDNTIQSPVTMITVRYYTLDGTCHTTPQKGFNMVYTQYSDGSVTVEKQWIR